MTLTLVGLSHHVAPVELRERVTLDLDAAAALARSLGDAVCLSTCNRTELYVDGIDERDVLAALEQLAGESLDGVVYRLHEDAAALHLFRVAAGLDSLVPGRGRDPRPGARRLRVRRRRARCSTTSSGRRSPSASACAPRRRSARAPRRSRRPPLRSPRRCSAT